MKDLTAKQKFFLYNSLYQDTFKEFSHNFHTTDLLEYQYNNFPMKPLGWKSPNEKYKEYEAMWS